MPKAAGTPEEIRKYIEARTPIDVRKRNIDEAKTEIVRLADNLGMNQVLLEDQRDNTDLTEAQQVQNTEQLKNVGDRLQEFARQLELLEQMERDLPIDRSKE
ncbi:hypothetical protein LCGC14_2473810 [marine sediment metagenome]|uniref:Uncharacterized protein n=1 Tax=marine sediment metagenome TaxID=412755 RepID=A0A0F9BXG1_9ZZZZ